MSGFKFFGETAKDYKRYRISKMISDTIGKDITVTIGEYLKKDYISLEDAEKGASIFKELYPLYNRYMHMDEVEPHTKSLSIINFVISTIPQLIKNSEA